MELQQQLDQANQNIKALVAQLEAAKQMVNEGLNSNLQLRTNITLLSQAHQELIQENSRLKTNAIVPETSPAE